MGMISPTPLDPADEGRRYRWETDECGSFPYGATKKAHVCSNINPRLAKRPV